MCDNHCLIMSHILLVVVGCMHGCAVVVVVVVGPVHGVIVAEIVIHYNDDCRKEGERNYLLKL